MSHIDIYVAPGEDIGISLDDCELSINVIGVDDFEDEETDEEDLDECCSNEDCQVCRPAAGVTTTSCGPNGCDAEKCCGGSETVPADDGLRFEATAIHRHIPGGVEHKHNVDLCLRHIEDARIGFLRTSS